MGDIVVKEDENIELTKVDGNLKIGDGAEIAVPSGTLVISGDLVSKGDIVIRGSVKVDNIKHDWGYLEIEGDVDTSYVKVSSRRSSNGSKLIITGSLNCGEIDIDGGLEVDKDLTAGDVEIGGSCIVHGETNVKDYDISGSAKHGMNLTATDIEVSGSLKVDGDVKSSSDFEISGSAKIEGILEAQEVSVGGSLKCQEIKCEEIEIGGSAKIEFGQITKGLEVGGAFGCSDSFTADVVSCGGSCGFGDDSKINKLEANGATKVGDNFQFKDVKVNGSFSFGIDAVGENLEVNGACSSKDNLKVLETIVVNGKLTGKHIEANKIEIAGGLECTEAKGQNILIQEDSRVRGKLVGGEVIVEDGARVDHIVADSVKLGDKVKVTRLESANIDAEDSAKYN
ncbi:MAG: hypothetical protein GOP50_04015 [Candidatus Heimdallarchaeota archaeon]|nr:hypothetical protein [Candidatus Heimdallarchaeota archaeon]